ncbi:unknown [Firmicutes bacterium CAG:240]|nr:unknown [Firmicutes bacterium CAG:240]
MLVIRFTRHIVEAGFILAQELRRSRAGLEKRRIYALEHRRDMVAQNIARVVIARVCLIAYIFDRVCGVIRLYLLPGRSQKWAHDVAALWRNAAKPL